MSTKRGVQPDGPSCRPSIYKIHIPGARRPRWTCWWRGIPPRSTRGRRLTRPQCSEREKLSKYIPDAMEIFSLPILNSEIYREMPLLTCGNTLSPLSVMTPTDKVCSNVIESHHFLGAALTKFWGKFPQPISPKLTLTGQQQRLWQATDLMAPPQVKIMLSIR